MKMSSSDRAAGARMAPGSIVAAGFLGEDSRPLADIIEADEEAFRALGLDFGLVAEGLGALLREGEAGLGSEVAHGKALVLSSDEARGKSPCPWGDGLHHKGSVRIGLKGSADFLLVSELSIHLLKDHHFCQGRGSPFRLEPSLVKRILGT